MVAGSFHCSGRANAHHTRLPSRSMVGVKSPITLIILTDRGSECNLTTSDTAWFRFGQECHTILLPCRQKTPACFQFAWLGGSWSSPFYIQFPSDPDTLYADESHCLASPEIRSDKDNPISCFCRDTIADAQYLYFCPNASFAMNFAVIDAGL